MINQRLIKNAKKVDRFLIRYLNKQNKSLLINPMKYGIISGGKKIRSTVILSAGKMFNLDQKKLINICASVECIHSYSLIHDDLPSMDNDDFRRGKQSNHKKFGEATAILAGDALHDFAFQLISENLKNINPKQNLKLINYLTKSTGHEGLAGGQSLDLLYENKNLSKNKVVEMYNKKTGKLFEFSFAAPFIIKNEKISKIKFGKNYGSIFGTIFQITDDILDEINSFKEIGKTPGKDKKQGKRTLLSILGKIKAIEFCDELAEGFIKKNKIQFSKYPALGDLLYYNIDKLK